MPQWNVLQGLLVYILLDLKRYGIFEAILVAAGKIKAIFGGIFSFPFGFTINVGELFCLHLVSQ